MSCNNLGICAQETAFSQSLQHVDLVGYHRFYLGPIPSPKLLTGVFVRVSWWSLCKKPCFQESGCLWLIFTFAVPGGVLRSPGSHCTQPCWSLSPQMLQLQRGWLQESQDPASVHLMTQATWGLYGLLGVSIGCKRELGK